jgi:drug/metabolite transporter (DMT)-like permease
MLFERIKYISVLLFFLFCLGLSIKFVVDGNWRLGWAGVALWGVMSVLTAYDIIRGYRASEAKNRSREKAKGAKAERAGFKFETVKAHLVTIWTIFAAVLIGTASNLVTEKIEGRLIPSIAVWLCSFSFTLLFYPFQKRQKEAIPTFPLWVVYSAAMGVVSIVFFYLKDWLR